MKVEEVICVLRRIMGQLLFFFFSKCKMWTIPFVAPESFGCSPNRNLNNSAKQTSTFRTGSSSCFWFFPPLFSYFSPLKVSKPEERWSENKVYNWSAEHSQCLQELCIAVPPLPLHLLRLIFPPFPPVASIHFSIFLKACCCLLPKMLTQPFGQTSRGPK